MVSFHFEARKPQIWLGMTQRGWTLIIEDQDVSVVLNLGVDHSLRTLLQAVAGLVRDYPHWQAELLRMLGEATNETQNAAEVDLTKGPLC